MSYRYRAYVQPEPQPPSALRLMTALVVAFVLVSLLVLLAGRLPFAPTPLAPLGTTYKEYAARDAELLSSYGNTLEGNVHIPIDRAMQLIVERGLPVRDTPGATP